ncbi:MAG: FMN-binding negative transcriptional regulator [Hyphomonadaceae bacterium]|nr:FMN-binding negative transcriptional regulator [Hyphomonadaceae bacterium]
MYGHPKHLLSEEEARAALKRFDRLAILVTNGAGGLVATHLPLVVQGEKLIGHVARANAHWREAPCDALVILPGAETYVSPSWYETKQRTGRSVPTWNYETLHVSGRLTIYEEPERLRENVAALSARHETGRNPEWKLEDAPEDYVAGLLRGIVGVEIAIARVEGKRKLSQDKPEADFAGVVAALADSADPRDNAVAQAMTSEA